MDQLLIVIVTNLKIKVFAPMLVQLKSSDFAAVRATSVAATYTSFSQVHRVVITPFLSIYRLYFAFLRLFIRNTMHFSRYNARLLHYVVLFCFALLRPNYALDRVVFTSKRISFPL